MEQVNNKIKENLTGIALVDFTLKGVRYAKGKEMKAPTKEKYIDLVERGFIEPIRKEEISNESK